MTKINSIPTINLSALWDDDSGIKEIALQLKEKLAPVGFAYLTNHPSYTRKFDQCCYWRIKTISHTTIRSKT